MDKKDMQKLYDLFAQLVGKRSHMLIDSLLISENMKDLKQNEMLNILSIVSSERKHLKKCDEYIANCMKILEERKEKISPNFKLL